MDVNEAALEEARTIARTLRGELRSLERRIDRLGRLAARLDDVLDSTDTSEEDTAYEHDTASEELELELAAGR